jgi:hypothetical protein
MRDYEIQKVCIKRKEMKPREIDINPAIKFPMQDEVIASPIYRMCVSAPIDVRTVDISVDDGPWRLCTKEFGYWWYDWMDYENGEYKIIARALGNRARWRMSASREVFVDVLRAIHVQGRALGYASCDVRGQVHARTVRRLVGKADLVKSGLHRKTTDHASPGPRHRGNPTTQSSLRRHLAAFSASGGKRD